MIMGDRDKGPPAADDEMPLATRAICLGHLSRNPHKNCGFGTWKIFSSITAIRFALTKESSKLVG